MIQNVSIVNDFLNKEQEEAMSMMFRHVGFQECYHIVEKYMIEQFGRQHKHTINLRLLLQPTLYKINDESRKLIDESGLSDLYMKRIDTKKN